MMCDTAPRAADLRQAARFKIFRALRRLAIRDHLGRPRLNVGSGAPLAPPPPNPFQTPVISGFPSDSVAVCWTFLPPRQDPCLEAVALPCPVPSSGSNLRQSQRWRRIELGFSARVKSRAIDWLGHCRPTIQQIRGGHRAAPRCGRSRISNRPSPACLRPRLGRPASANPSASPASAEPESPQLEVQLTTLPSVPLRHVKAGVGFIHSILATTPEILMGLLASYSAAKE